MAVATQTIKTQPNFFTRFVEYSGTTIGLIRDLSLVRGVCRLYHEVLGPSEVAKNMASNTGTAMAAVGVVLLPGVVAEAVTSIAKLGKDDGASTARKTAVAVQNTFGAAHAVAGAGAFVLGLPLRNVATLLDAGQDVVDLGVSVADYRKVSQLEEASAGELKESYAHTRQYNLLRIVKAVLAVTSGIFAALFILHGWQLLPLIAAIFLSIATTLVAIRRDMFKSEGVLADLSKI